jgi:hypothetical protein
VFFVVQKARWNDKPKGDNTSQSKAILGHYFAHCTGADQKPDLTVIKTLESKKSRDEFLICVTFDKLSSVFNISLSPMPPGIAGVQGDG